MALAGFLAVGVAGCGAEGDAGGAAVPEVSGTPRVQEKKDLPELPLARYEFSHDDYARQTEAAARLAQRWMKRYGFDDVPLYPKPPGGSVVGLTAVAGDPFGLLDLDKARRWGYGWDPERAVKGREARTGRAATPAEYEVLYGLGGRGALKAIETPKSPKTPEAPKSPEAPEARETSEVRTTPKVPEGGCSGEGQRRLMAGVEDEKRLTSYAFQGSRRVERAVARDPKARRALKAWSQCVVDKGFKRYARPSAAFGDKAWRRGQDGNTEHGKRELGTAVADVECNRAHNLAGILWATRAREERREIARHHATYDAVRADRERVRVTVRGVLGGS
ncbi:hypothetical protein [Streptomyces sp. NPDC059009]|uniref:hypothetical protein n=1 Tax=Streptomyces sp. NPDC059009 TaxID=3346694 RepID=UPI003682E217